MTIPGIAKTTNGKNEVPNVKAKPYLATIVPIGPATTSIGIEVPNKTMIRPTVNRKIKEISTFKIEWMPSTNKMKLAIIPAIPLQSQQQSVQIIEIQTQEYQLVASTCP